MRLEPSVVERARFLVRIVGKEIVHLQQTDNRLFDESFSVERVALLEQDATLAERVEAFSSRFSRLQDTVGDKLLPLMLHLFGEQSGPFIDNLDRAECLGFIESVDRWMEIRKLRNQMVHEYIEDPVQFASALNAGHQSVVQVIHAAEKVVAEIQRRIT